MTVIKINAFLKMKTIIESYVEILIVSKLLAFL